MIYQKVMEGQTQQLSDGLDMFERDNLISDKVFEKYYGCLCQCMTDFSSVVFFLFYDCPDVSDLESS